MADLAQRRLGAAAAAAVGVSAWCAAAAAGDAAGWTGGPLVFIGVVLAAAVRAALSREPRRVLRPGGEEKVLAVVTVVGLLGLFLAGWADMQRVVDVAKVLPVVIAGLSVMWPAPKVLRFSLLLAVVTLLAGAGGPAPSGLAVAGALVAMAAALVLTNRLTAAAAPRLGGSAPAPARRLAGESATVLVIVALLAALAASLLPPPPSPGGGGGDGRQPLPSPGGTEIHFDNPLDLTAGRDEPGDGYVLMVAARRPEMWRALTYDRWDGETWSRSEEEPAYLDDGRVSRGIGDLGTNLDGSGLFQSVTVLARSADVLPAAAVARYLSLFAGAALQGADASVYPEEPVGRGARYEVFSEPQAASAAELRAVGDTPARVLPLDVGYLYLQLPQVSARVRALSAQVVVREANTFDKARAVEDWIDRNTEVTDGAPPVPAGVDPLEDFLLEGRAGPPDRAATAMVVMLRAVGVPARLAVGFLPGRRTGPNREFLVRSRDAHAWVEVWFPTLGWQRFDPTGRAPDPRAEPDSAWDRLLRFLERLWPVVVLVLVAGAGWLAWRLAAWRRRRAALPWATRYFAQLERAGRARGRPRQPPETPAEYARALARDALPDPRIEEAGELVTVAAWSRHEPPAADRARAEAALRAAKKAAPARRLRLRRRGRPTIAKP
ncbi:MAG TPA: transglutaminase-like domain-containing protein [Acidimicrobiales bacterium]|nr:transglutaminase-like domain-containing protein [Acidimicrobiales bacterium]